MRLDAPEKLVDLVDYQDGSIVSKVLEKSDSGSVTVFAFTQGQELSEHTAPYTALVQILDGNAEVKIGEKTHVVSAGEVLTMPKNITHALRARTDFKMLLIMVK
jgi:quercetin dioxygenase-like cupin family protein